MATETILVPDLGGAQGVDVIEVCVAVGDVIEAEQSIVVLETDKASMEIPAPKSGKVVALHIKEGDSLAEGAALIDLDVAATDSDEAADVETGNVENLTPQPSAVESTYEANNKPAQEQSVSPESTPSSAEVDINVPDIGSSDSVEVIEICVAVGEHINEGDSIVVLESDKSSMEIPASCSGEVLAIKVANGDSVVTGDALLVVKSNAPVVVATVAEKQAVEPEKTVQTASAASSSIVTPPITTSLITTPASSVSDTPVHTSGDAYAGPAVRKLARQLGVDMSRVKASGPKNRLQREDIRSYVRDIVADSESGKLQSGSGIPAIPDIDFAKFGDIETVKLSKIAKLTVQSMTRSWLNVPHVTQFDEADITEMEAFRKSMKTEAEQRGVRLTPLPFLLKAVAAALVKEPSFNVSLHNDGEHLIKKNYVNIGIAVDTPKGLLVPVVKDVDKKGLWELAAETAELADKARSGKLMPQDMQGGCFTISSLGAMGGTGFTPIVSAPEVAIMGVSKAQIKPIWSGTEFLPRQMLPLSVSYDHRAINGADCGRFFTYLVGLLTDIRRLVL